MGFVLLLDCWLFLFLLVVGVHWFLIWDWFWLGVFVWIFGEEVWLIIRCGLIEGGKVLIGEEVLIWTYFEWHLIIFLAYLIRSINNSNSSIISIIFITLIILIMVLHFTNDLRDFLTLFSAQKRHFMEDGYHS